MRIVVETSQLFVVPPPVRSHLPDDALEAVLVPLDGLGLVDLVGGADLGLAAAALGNTLTGAGHADVEVHTVDTVAESARRRRSRQTNPNVPDARIVLDAQIDVLGDTETEVAGLGEVALAELVLLDLQATLENLLSLGATDGDVDGDPGLLLTLRPLALALRAQAYFSLRRIPKVRTV